MFKRMFYTAIFLSISILVFSQDKKFDKIVELYQQSKYEDCIEKAEKYIDGDATSPQPYFYIADSKFQIFKLTTDNSAELKLKGTVRQTFKACSKDKDKTVRYEFADFMKELKDTMLTYGSRFYALESKEDAEFYYEYIAKIYNDTTEEYKDLFFPKVVTVEQELAFGNYSGPKNQVDMEGNKLGLWVEYYDNGIVKQEINFVNNKPVGVFRKYYENGKLKANLVFDETSTKSSAILYNEKGLKVAMGYYVNQQKDSLWQYFIGDTIVLMEENYDNGVKSGYNKIYFASGLILEEKNYLNGVEHGAWRRYYENGQEMFETKYVDGKLDGPYVKYYSTGILYSNGKYKNNLRDSTWYFYNNETNEKVYITYKDGVAENQEELDRMQNEWFKENEENNNILLDPGDYISNPDEFIRTIGN